MQRPEHFCRSSLVPQFESLAKIPESRLVATESGRPPNMLLADGDTPVATPARTVWLVCTSNALTVYDGPSRRARIATLSTRKLYAVEPGAPPLLVQGEQQRLFGVLAGFHTDLPATVRPPPHPQVEHRQLAYAALFFPTAGMQHKWLQVLKQAAEPRPTAIAPPSLQGVPSQSISQQAVRAGVAPGLVEGVGSGATASADLIAAAAAALPLAAAETGRPPPVPAVPGMHVVPPISMGMSNLGASAKMMPSALNSSSDVLPSMLPLGALPIAASPLNSSSDILPRMQPTLLTPAVSMRPSEAISMRPLEMLSPAQAVSVPVAMGGAIPVLPMVPGAPGIIPSGVGLAASHDLLPVMAPVIPVIPPLMPGGIPGQSSISTIRPTVPIAPVSLLPVDAGAAVMEDDVDDPFIPAIEAVAIGTVAAVVADIMD